MQESAAEDLLNNVENLALAVGEVLVTSASTNVSNETSRTITRENIGILLMCTHICTFVRIYVAFNNKVILLFQQH